MASVGHIAVGMAASRVYGNTRATRWSSMAWWSLLSLLPDADVIGFALGVEYADPWGHRGATHSLTLSIAVGVAIGLAARWFKRSAVRTALVASVVLVSHALLDTMTDGGLGCALLWPFNLTRYFAPWRPIPVAPIGLDFFSVDGLTVALTELVLFAPVIVFALRRPTHVKKVFIPVWSAAVWLIVSGDPIRDAVLGFLLREDTEYASGFSDRSFQAIRPGDLDADVRRLVGAPLGEWWDYDLRGTTGCPFLYLEADVVTTNSATGPVDALCAQHGIRPGASRADVQRALGSPRDWCWRYSRSPGNRHYRARVVCFSDGRVVEVFRQWTSR